MRASVRRRLVPTRGEVAVPYDGLRLVADEARSYPVSLHLPSALVRFRQCGSHNGILWS